MPAQDDYDAEEVADRLTPWLGDRMGAPAEITSLTAPGESGFSSETMLLEVRVQGHAGPERLVVKTRPAGFTVFPTYDMWMQYRCMESVGRHSQVPVPRVRWYEGDESVLGRAFYVMDRVEGQVPTDNPPYTIGGFLYEARPDEQETLYRSSLEVLAQLHALDWRAAGLGFLERPELGATGLEQQLAVFADYLPFATLGEPHPPLEETYAWLVRHRPEGLDECLNWGDARIGNIMYADFRPVAVLDWEMACVGPPEVDLAWYLYFFRFFSSGLGLPNLPGIPDDDVGVAHYEACLGRQVRALEYFRVWAGFRYAAILVRLFQRMIEEGTMMEGWTLEENPMVQLMLDVRAEAGG